MPRFVGIAPNKNPLYTADATNEGIKSNEKNQQNFKRKYTQVKIIKVHNNDEIWPRTNSPPFYIFMHDRKKDIWKVEKHGFNKIHYEEMNCSILQLSWKSAECSPLQNEKLHVLRSLRNFCARAHPAVQIT